MSGDTWEPDTEVWDRHVHRPTYRVGDVANGHVLRKDGVWVPVAQAQATLPLSPAQWTAIIVTPAIFVVWAMTWLSVDDTASSHVIFGAVSAIAAVSLAGLTVLALVSSRSRWHQQRVVELERHLDAVDWTEGGGA